MPFRPLQQATGTQSAGFRVLKPAKAPEAPGGQNGQGGAPQGEKKGFLAKVRGDLESRRAKVTEGFEAESRGKQSTAESIFQTIGQGVGFLGDVAMRGVESVGRTLLPKAAETAIEGGISTVGKKIAESPVGQAVGKFAAEHPRATRNIEAGINIASAIPALKGAQAGSEVVSGAERVAGKILKEAGEEGVEVAKKDFVRELTRPIRTKAIKEAEVARTTEIGSGPFKRSVVAPTAREAKAAEEVAKLEGVTSKNTFQQNYNAIKAANTSEANALKTTLKQKDFVFTRKELLARLRRTKEELARNPVITGDAEKTADKLIAEIERRVEATPAKGSNLLQVRKEFDNWVESQKGGNAFDPSKENAFSVSNRAIRRTINDFLDEKAPDAGVKASLKKQSALYDALDNIAPKAAEEADTAIGRMWQRAGRILGTKNKIVQIVAATAGIGGLGAAATFAPAAAATGIGGFLLYRGGKWILKPQMRQALGELIISLEKAKSGKVIGGAVGAAAGITPTQVDELQKEIKDFMKEYND